MGTVVLDRFDHVAATWRPRPQVDRDLVTADAPRRFAALLDVDSPVVSDRDVLPPLWHWLLFPPLHPQSALGPDGHPLEAPLMPPVGPRRRMFGGGRLQVVAPVRCGDRVDRCSEVTDVRSRMGRSGPLLLVTLRHSLTVDDELRVIEEQDIVYLPPARHDPAAGAPPVPLSGHDVPAPDSRWGFSLVPDPVLLFRFSALTTNAHRIHYDRPYARDVEGHPEVVVHGPLLALLLLELPRRHRPDRSVATFAWRARAPLYAGQLIHVHGQLDDTGATLSAGAADEVRAVAGSVTFANGT